MPRSISAMLGFAIGVAVGMSFFYPKDLHPASIYGNLEAVRLIVTSSAQEPLVLDRALRISAGLGRLDIAKLLVEHGASDMDGALRQAAVRNQMPIVRWLVAPERSPPRRLCQFVPQRNVGGSRVKGYARRRAGRARLYARHARSALRWLGLY